MPGLKFFKGAHAKKILHVGHLLIEFLRKVLKAVGKTAHHAVEKANHGLHGAGKSKGAIKASKGGKAASAKSAGFASKGAGTSLGSTGSAATGAAAGGAGASASLTTIATLVVVSTVAIGGVGVYSVMTNQNPIAVLQEAVSVPSQSILPKISQQMQQDTFSAGQEAFSKSFQPEIQHAVVTEQQTNNQQTSSTSQTSTQQNSPQTGGGSTTTDSNTPYKDQSINYQVPENPKDKK
jgi:uncharacterized spore protein YtfJ